MPDADPLTAAPRQAAGGLVLLAGVATALTGLVLVVAYRPDELRWLRTFHAGAAAVAVVSAIAARVVARNGQLKVSARGAAFVVLAVIVLGGAFASGSLLRWEGGASGDRGVFLDSAHRYTVDGTVVSARSIVVSAILHSVLGVCAFVLLGWDHLRSKWRRRA